MIVPLDDDFIRRVTSYTAHFLKVAIGLFGKESSWHGCEGGYFCIANHKTGLPYLIVPIGKTSNSRAESYFALCQKEIRKLAGHPRYASNRQCSETNPREYACAVRGGKYIFSLSGFPAPGSETILASVVAMLEDAIWADTQIILLPAASDNPYWPPMLEAVKKLRDDEDLNQVIGT